MPGPCARQQPDVAGARYRFLGPGLFQGPRRPATGIFIGEALKPRPPYQGAPFFGVSRRRNNEDGSFAGVIQALVLPEYFENFYARIGREPGSFLALGLTDGSVLARFPAPTTRSARPRRALGRQSPPARSRPHHGHLAGRRHRTPARLSAAGRISDLCQRRARNLGDPGALARDHGPAPDFRRAGHRAVVSAAALALQRTQHLYAEAARRRRPRRR